MRIVGRRHESPLSLHASAEKLVEGARFCEAMSGLSRMPFIPKGVSRFKTHEEANQHWDLCLAQGMAQLAASRIR